jgi:hypothetical protein
MISAPLIFFGAMVAVPAEAPALPEPLPTHVARASTPLLLGTYGYGSPYRDLVAVRDAANSRLPRFETSIEVVGRPTPEPNVTMAVWWQHWNFETAIYGRGINIQSGQHGVNIIPLIEWLAKKVRKNE